MILFMKPHFEAKPWAGKKLNSIYDCPEKTGEAWIISGYKGKSSIVINGKYKGQTLRHLWSNHPELFGSFDDKEFPILLKVIDSSERLSVQVHPNDEYAFRKKNSLGKYECWYFLPNNEAKFITIGVDCKNVSELKRSLKSGDFDKNLINKEINCGDLVVIEPGRIHALHENSFILEVQESSDITFRIYDYNREPKRELHIEDSLNVIQFNNNKGIIHKLCDTNYFDSKHFLVEKLAVKGTSFYNLKEFKVVYIISGQGAINEFRLKTGDVFIITKEENQSEIKFTGEMDIIIVSPKQKGKERQRLRKIAFITGISSQDGSYLAELLLEKGYEVHGMIQNAEQAFSQYIAAMSKDEEVFNNRLFYHIGDLTDSSNLNRLIEKIKPDEIYHLASQSNVPMSYELPELTANVNALGTLRILDAIKDADLRAKVFNLSTSQLFSGEIGTVPQNEHTVFDPQNPYAISKLYSHYIAKNYRENFGLFVCNGICFNHESPRRSVNYVTKKIVEHVKQIANGKKKIILIGNLDSKRDWGYAKDYVEGMWLMLQQDKPNDYVLGTCETHTVREFIEESFECVGIKIRWCGQGLDEVGINVVSDEMVVKVDYTLTRTLDAQVYCGDYSKAKKDLGWEPKVRFKDLVKLMMISEL